MNVLTISTLFHKGGAAYIAKVLHNGLKSTNIDTKYLVGYGKNGKADQSLSKDFVYSEYSLPRITPAINLVLHNLIGKDFLSPRKKHIEEMIEWSDVIVCHTLHSYFINYEFLFKIFKKFEKTKKIILVAHDSWHYTGRCAFVFDCDKWKSGCTNCENLNYYPPSKYMSITKSEFIKKQNLLSDIENLNFVSPARWICDDIEKVYPNNKVSLIRNSIETDFYKKIERRYNMKNIEICVSSVDVTQPGKINLKIVEELLDLGVKVHFIGKNNPFKDHQNSIDHGFITDKNKYVEVLKNVDCYLFTSDIDIYPTVLVEAICSGMYVFYTASKGSLEVMEGEHKWLGRKIQTAADIYSIINKDDDFNNVIVNESAREEKRSIALDFYKKERMVDEYLKLF